MPKSLPPNLSDLERDAWIMLMANGFPEPVEHFPFHKDRKWEFDFAWPVILPQEFRKIALECEGGTWTGGRHVRGTGFENDCEKYSVAAAMGWRVIRATANQIRDGRFLEWLRMAGLS